MFENVSKLIDRHKSFVLTTHDYPDADGLGAELVFASILKEAGKDFTIINSSEVPLNLHFLKKESIFKEYVKEEHDKLISDSALVILDTSDENHLGPVKEMLDAAKEIFVLDHHEYRHSPKLSGFIDNTAASTCEITIELVCSMGIDLDQHTATAAYAGIAFDSGFFAYPKTSIRTFKAAIKTIEWGAKPHYIYNQLMENSSYTAILLQRQALLNLEYFARKKIALIVLRREDYRLTGAKFEETENIVNIPLKTKEVEVSLLIRENNEGNVRCSLRSKGKINVSQVAQEFGGGGHVTAAGFKSSTDTEKTIKKLLAVVEARLDIC